MTHALTTALEWRRQIWGTGARALSTSNDFLFCSLWSKSDNQLYKYCIVCKIPLSSDRQHLSYDGCLEVEGRLSELFCVAYCIVVQSYAYEDEDDDDELMISILR